MESYEQKREEFEILNKKRGLPQIENPLRFNKILKIINRPTNSIRRDDKNILKLPHTCPQETVLSRTGTHKSWSTFFLPFQTLLFPQDFRASARNDRNRLVDEGRFSGSWRHNSVKSLAICGYFCVRALSGGGLFF